MKGLRTSAERKNGSWSTVLKTPVPAFGDAYTFVAIERHTKLVLNFALGRRNQETTDIFIEGLRHATASDRFQISTDGFIPYRSAIDTTLNDRVSFAQLIKIYASPREGEQRYSPSEVVEAVPVPKEVGEPVGCALPALRVLQLLPNPSRNPHYACDGCWDNGPYMGYQGSAS